MKCDQCRGSGGCDPCDGYGCTPNSYRNAGDGIECQLCEGTGRCTECGGIGETTKANEFNERKECA